MSAFEKLKNNRLKGFDAINEQMNALQKRSFSNDSDKFWKPTRDNTGNGSAIIRFIMGDPNADNDPSFVRYWEHGFKGPTGQWYIEKSLTTLSQPDPVAEYNSVLWNSGSEDNKKIATAQKRKLTYVANILVIKDPANPANEGKVFMYKFGQKIFDKLKKISSPDPDYPDDEKINPFDLWAGVNFRLRIKTVSNFPNYDDSDFDRRTSAIAEDDEEINAIWEQRHNLAELVAPESFKSYDKLKERLDIVLGNTKVGAGSQESGGFGGRSNFTFDDENEEKEESKFDLSKKFDDEPSIPSSKSKSAMVDEDDEDEAYFQNLRNRN